MLVGVTLFIVTAVYVAYRVLKYKLEKQFEGDWFKDIEIWDKE